VTLSIRTTQLRDIAQDVRRRLTASDLKQRLAVPDIGPAAATSQLRLLCVAAAAFPEAMTPQLSGVANALTLGADDAETADRTDAKPGPK